MHQPYKVQKLLIHHFIFLETFSRQNKKQKLCATDNFKKITFFRQPKIKWNKFISEEELKEW